MKKYLYSLIPLFLVLCLFSCRKDFDFEPAQAGQLSFSADTIFLDTIFNNIRSSTRVLSVRNNSDNDIRINSVQLRRGLDSKYQLNVDGLPNNSSELTPESGKLFTDVEILANDSIFVFIEATIDPLVDEIDKDQNYLDEILFQTSSEELQVQLSTQVIDAEFSFTENTEPPRSFVTQQRDENGEFIVIRGYNLSDNELNITDARARVFFGNAVVPSGKTLNIGSGSRVFFSRGSSLIVEDGATLNILGELSPTDAGNDSFTNEVILEGNRIDEDFDNLPGQWNFIWVQQGGVATIQNTIIKNATTGILAQGMGNETAPNVQLNNVQIYNSQTVGIQANASFITANNLVINQSGRGAINIEEGGTYTFTHSTFSSTFNFGGVSQTAIILNNNSSETSNVTSTDLEASFTNCIIVGSRRDEITINNTQDANFDLTFTNCLIDLNNNNSAGLNLDDTELFQDCIFNGNPDFKNTRLNNLRISNNSAANGGAVFLPGNDIIGTQRTAPSDIGAYESINFEEE